MARKLKVFRTPTGFHDAYVAAASQKDALAAWGSDANLFARGIAELVTDPKLIKEPLARPGHVIKVMRGSAKDHLAALPPESVTPNPAKRPQTEKDEPRATPKKAKPRQQPKPKPKPSRAKLDAAEQALADAEREQRAVIDDLRRRELELQRERQQVETRQAAELIKLERAADRAAAAYNAAVGKWRG